MIKEIIIIIIKKHTYIFKKTYIIISCSARERLGGIPL